MEERKARAAKEYSIIAPSTLMNYNVHMRKLLVGARRTRIYGAPPPPAPFRLCRPAAACPGLACHAWLFLLLLPACRPMATSLHGLTPNLHVRLSHVHRRWPTSCLA